MLAASFRHLTRRAASVVVLHSRTISAIKSERDVAKSKQDEAGVIGFASDVNQSTHPPVALFSS